MEIKGFAERAAYIDGLMKGKNIDDEVTSEIVSLLYDMARELEFLGSAYDDIEEELADIEDVLEGEDDDDDYYDFDEDDEDDDIYEAQCPNCKKMIMFADTDITDHTVECPYCGTQINIIKEEDGTE